MGRGSFPEPGYQASDFHHWLAARVHAGALRRGIGETIRAVLLSADLRDFTALSEATEPAAMIAALDASFDRIAWAVHAFGGEVLKFIGDGVLAIFPVTGAPAEACEAALRAVAAETTTPPVPLGEHALRGIAAPCTVFALPDA